MSSGNGSIATAQYAKAIGSRPPSAGWMPETIDYNIHYKEKKMGWFRKKFNNWVRRAWEDASKADLSPVRSEEVDAKASVRFTVYPANGGYVIQHYKTNRYQDSEGPTLTIVPNGESIGEAVEHAIAIEALKA